MSPKFVVAVEKGSAERVNAAVTETGDWWRAQLRRVHLIPDPAERRRERARVEGERDRRRREGLYRDNVSAVILHHLLAELGARGWLGREWQPVPHGEASLPGRPWGVERGSRGSLRSKLTVSVPDDVAELIRRATYWASAPAVRRLQQLSSLERPITRSELEEQAKLRAKIVTTGDLIRAAIDRVAPPSPAPR
ncbi:MULTISPECIES: hypothetical protein [unclassified Amycolatopsis]|uniref:hypothetical protein n=1 Tax=unclassified Amycolatopsis TaxID=2618356 RepID=UPI002875CD71|nr:MULTISPECIES: hypothetical protein [unclassified Amycolatopsis]MDS0140604.1 hypothetical protein [Amycolatopsis sp. 505]MDS0149254.1 hypothetical protein [Amycolatopsis sp. CM201R]